MAPRTAPQSAIRWHAASALLQRNLRIGFLRGLDYSPAALDFPFAPVSLPKRSPWAESPLRFYYLAPSILLRAALQQWIVAALSSRELRSHPGLAAPPALPADSRWGAHLDPNGEPGGNNRPPRLSRNQTTQETGGVFNSVLPWRVTFGLLHPWRAGSG